MANVKENWEQDVLFPWGDNDWDRGLECIQDAVQCFPGVIAQFKTQNVIQFHHLIVTYRLVHGWQVQIVVKDVASRELYACEGIDGTPYKAAKACLHNFMSRFFHPYP